MREWLIYSQVSADLLIQGQHSTEVAEPPAPDSQVSAELLIQGQHSTEVADPPAPDSQVSAELLIQGQHSSEVADPPAPVKAEKKQELEENKLTKQNLIQRNSNKVSPESLLPVGRNPSLEKETQVRKRLDEDAAKTGPSGSIDDCQPQHSTDQTDDQRDIVTEASWVSNTTYYEFIERSYYTYHQKFLQLNMSQLSDFGLKNDGSVVYMLLNGQPFQVKFKEILDFHYGTCLTFEMDEEIKKIMEKYLVEEDLLKEELVQEINMESGYIIVVHDAEYWPNMKLQGISLNPGFRTTIITKKVKYNKLPYPFSNCVKENYVDKHLFPFKYTKELCLKKCLADKYRRECNCILKMIPGFDTVVSGGEKIPPCFEAPKCYRNFRKEDCHCRDPCSYTFTDNEITMSEWPNDRAARLLINEMCHTPLPRINCTTFKNKSDADLREFTLTVTPQLIAIRQWSYTDLLIMLHQFIIGSPGIPFTV
ncbi:hypothetical protein Btru_010862 [Bulinus truncatus]|nr:hypothetical protein Btru_010862 [Bulinus truncatus]